MCPGARPVSARWVSSRILNSTRTAKLLLRQSSGSFPGSESGRSCGNVQRSRQLTARRCQGGCIQVEHLSLGFYSHSDAWIQPPQILYIPFTPSPFQSHVFGPRDLISSPTRNRVFSTLCSSVTCLSDYHLLKPCADQKSESAARLAYYNSARSPPRPAVTWPATSPLRKFCHILACSPPRPAVTWSVARSAK